MKIVYKKIGKLKCGTISSDESGLVTLTKFSKKLFFY